jgi:hypothetical protein
MKFGLEVLARFPARAVRFLRDTRLNAFPKTDAGPKALPPAANPYEAGVARSWATRRAVAAAAADAAPAAPPPNAKRLTGEAFRARREEREAWKGEQKKIRQLPCRRCGVEKMKEDYTTHQWEHPQKRMCRTCQGAIAEKRPPPRPPRPCEKCGPPKAPTA